MACPALDSCLANLTALTSAYAACDCGLDPCADSAIGEYGLGLHAAAVVIVAFASFVGAAFPLLAKCACGRLRRRRQQGHARIPCCGRVPAHTHVH